LVILLTINSNDGAVTAVPHIFIMGKKKELSSELRAQITTLHEHGLSQREISSDLGISQPCVQRTLRRFSELGSYRSRKRSGRPRATSIRDDHIIRRTSVAHPTASAAYIARQLPPTSRPSLSTIKRRLHDDFGLKAHRPARKPALSKKNIMDRVAFCRRYEHWSQDDWSKVLFSDETMVRQFTTYTPHVRRPPGTRFEARYTVPVVKHSPSVMIWGCLSVTGPGALWEQKVAISGREVALTNIPHSLAPFSHFENTNLLFQQVRAFPFKIRVMLNF
jgi:transposase